MLQQASLSFWDVIAAADAVNCLLWKHREGLISSDSARRLGRVLEVAVGRGAAGTTLLPDARQRVLRDFSRERMWGKEETQGNGTHSKISDARIQSKSRSRAFNLGGVSS
jgi:hypothetical protein